MLQFTHKRAPRLPKIEGGAQQIRAMPVFRLVFFMASLRGLEESAERDHNSLVSGSVLAFRIENTQKQIGITYNTVLGCFLATVLSIPTAVVHKVHCRRYHLKQLMVSKQACWAGCRSRPFPMQLRQEAKSIHLRFTTLHCRNFLPSDRILKPNEIYDVQKTL